ncbi:MAG: hypothetical protein KGY54_08980 [Oleiphilaceae bacterium]|nr:hypothetical protein [Oleiphilaceae bacterium]
MRLSIDLSPQQHRELKMAAAREGKTIKDYLLQGVLPEAGASRPEGASAVEAVRSSRSQGAEQGGGRASKSVEEIFEEMMRDQD